MKYSEFFWKHTDTLCSDTSLAHSFGEKVWNHQQAKADKVLVLIEEFKKNPSDDQRLFLTDLFKQIEVTLK